MPAWVFIVPPVERRNPRFEEYVGAIGADGRPEKTRFAIKARRFATSSSAREWARQFGELLEDYAVGRR